MGGLLSTLQVREIDVTSDTEDIENTNKVLQISKLNPHCPDFIPKNLDNASKSMNEAAEKLAQKPKPPNKQKQNRNVALRSILELGGTTMVEGNEPKKLIKPVELSPTVTASVKKVHGWLDAQEKHDALDTESVLSLDSSSMFRKKKISPLKQSHKTVQPLKNTKLVQPPLKDRSQILSIDPSVMFRKKVPPKVVAVECNKVTAKVPRGCENYVPSANAEEYYKKYLERSKVHEVVHEDMWTRAERQMKEIDERRLVPIFLLFYVHKTCSALSCEFFRIFATFKSQNDEVLLILELNNGFN